jgi:LPS sulfotransferase NodH
MPSERLIGGRPHQASQYYEKEMDFNCFGEDPVTNYMLATIPRSGSTYCAIRFWQSGLLGAPMEYLNFRVVGSLLRRLGYSVEMEAMSLESYWHDVQRLRTSPNGVFGFKMFIANYVEISKRVPSFLNEIRPNHVVYLTRRDAIGQAMSYSRAQKSKVWFGGVPRTPEVGYDFSHIKMCLRSINHQKNAWERAFELTGTDPIRITYEDLLERGESCIAEVQAAMGIGPDTRAAIKIPMIERQTDGVSREWRERFLEDSRREEDLVSDTA